jgi:hypothetical protein
VIQHVKILPDGTVSGIDLPAAGQDQRRLIYELNLDEMVPWDHLLRPINVFATVVLTDFHQQQLTTF